MSESTNKICLDPNRKLSVERVALAKLPTEWGDFMIAGYRSLTSEEEFVVLFKGEMKPGIPTLVRIHSQCLTGDVFASTKCDCGLQLHRTMEMIQQEGRGAIVYRLADDNVQTNPISNGPLTDEEYVRAFVATQYFGYLRRDADIGGFLFWLGQVSSAPLRDLSKQKAMVCSFITSGEYQQRFSPVVTHSNAECAGLP